MESFHLNLFPFTLITHQYPCVQNCFRKLKFNSNHFQETQFTKNTMETIYKEFKGRVKFFVVSGVVIIGYLTTR